MPKDVVVVGAGGFGRETLDVLDAVNAQSSQPAFNVLGVLDDRPSETNLKLLGDRGIRYLGNCHDWLKTDSNAHFLIGIGNPAFRKQIADRFSAAGKIAAVAIHPRAVLGSQLRLGPGVIVCSGVQISTNVTLRAHVHLNPGVIIGHDSSLGECVSVNPGAVVSGNVDIEDNVLVGAGAIILQGLNIANDVTVGAGGVVVRNVSSHAVVRGVPAR